MKLLWWFWLLLGSSASLAIALGLLTPRITELETRTEDRVLTAEMKTYLKSMLAGTHGEIRIVHSPSPDALGLATQLASALIDEGWLVNFDPHKLEGNTPLTQFRGNTIESVAPAGTKIEGAELKLATALFWIGLRANLGTDPQLPKVLVRLGIGERDPSSPLAMRRRDKRCVPDADAIR